MHQRIIHDNEKPFKCEICQKKFGYKSTLDNHQRIVHDKNKLFKCEICQKKFGLKSNMSKHYI